MTKEICYLRTPVTYVIANKSGEHRFEFPAGTVVQHDGPAPRGNVRVILPGFVCGKIYHSRPLALVSGNDVLRVMAHEHGEISE